MTDLDLAWRVCRHVRSNAIVLVKDGVVVGVGAGQMSRVDSARLAVDKAGPGAGDGARSAPRMRSSRSPTRSRSAPRPGSPRSPIRAARSVTPRSSPPRTRPGAAVLLTGVRHFRH